MANTKLTTLAALLAASTAGNIYLSTDGATFEQVTLPPEPIIDTLLPTAPQDCLAEIQAVGDDPSCSLVTSWYPIGGKLKYPTPVYTDDGVAVPPTLAEMREINFVQREVWACGDGAVMPQRIQDCLSALQPTEPVAVE